VPEKPLRYGACPSTYKLMFENYKDTVPYSAAELGRGNGACHLSY